MKPYLFLGDTHGDLAFAQQAIQLARKHRAEIIQLGDWGFIWPGVQRKVEALSEALVWAGVQMRFIDGNHDEHPVLRAYARGVNALAPGEPQATQIAPNVIYQPRGSTIVDEDGTRFLFLGGAASIDRDSRVPGISWWPEETITREELAIAREVKGPVHVMVTHDAPAFPPGFGPKGSPLYRQEERLSMKRVDTLVQRHRPTFLLHGHWHTRYERGHAFGTRVIGLDCNLNRFDDAVLLWQRAP